MCIKDSNTAIPINTTDKKTSQTISTSRTKPPLKRFKIQVKLVSWFIWLFEDLHFYRLLCQKCLLDCLNWKMRWLILDHTSWCNAIINRDIENIDFAKIIVQGIIVVTIAVSWTKLPTSIGKLKIILDSWFVQFRVNLHLRKIIISKI